jgi:hypothetical protein
MRLGRIGGILFAAGAVCYLVALAIQPPGGSVGPIDASSATLIAATLLGGLGAAVLAFARPAPLDGRAIRVGLGLLAAGLLSLTAGGVGNAVALAAGSDPLSSGVVLLLLFGLPVTFSAIVVLSVALAVTPGPTRLVGGVLLAAAACFVVILAGAAARALVSVEGQSDILVPGVVGTIGLVCLMLGGMGIGALAIFGPLPD